MLLWKCLSPCMHVYLKLDVSMAFSISIEQIRFFFPYFLSNNSFFYFLSSFSHLNKHMYSSYPIVTYMNFHMRSIFKHNKLNYMSYKCQMVYIPYSTWINLGNIFLFLPYSIFSLVTENSWFIFIYFLFCEKKFSIKKNMFYENHLSGTREEMLLKFNWICWFFNSHYFMLFFHLGM
jgi:hypothetical protein